MYESNYTNNDKRVLRFIRTNGDGEQDEEDEPLYYQESQYFTCNEDVENKLHELMGKNDKLRHDMKRQEEELQSLRAENDGYKEEYFELLKSYEALKRQRQKDLCDMENTQRILEEQLEKEKEKKAKCMAQMEHMAEARRKDESEGMAEAKRKDELERMTQVRRKEGAHVQEPTLQEQGDDKSAFALQIIDRTQVYITDEDCSKDKVDFVKDLYHNIFENFESSRINKKINRIKKKPASPPSSQNVFQDGAIRLGNGSNAVIGGVQNQEK
jgi:chromosome segregation ATPase